jgi:hypothetical protein
MPAPEEERAMLHSFVRRNVGEIDFLIHKAERRLSQYGVKTGRVVSVVRLFWTVERLS